MPKKVNEVMPLDIVRFMADTVHMDAEQTGAYLLAFATQWNVGPLPNSLAICARIMRLSGPNSEKTVHTLLRRYFHQLPDGTWINLSNQARRLEAELQAKRFSERAQKANSVRWQGHVAKYTRKTPSRTPQEVLENYQGVLRDSLLESNKESILQSSWIPYGVPENLVLEVQNPSSSLRSEGRKRGRALKPGNLDGKPVAQLPAAAQQKAKTRRTPLKSTSEASAKVRPSIPPTSGKKTSPARHPSRNPPGKSARPNPQKPVRTPDPRFAPFRKEFFRFWAANHPDGPNHPWGVEDGASLNRLLKANPQLSLRGFQVLLKNRATSSPELVNISQAPFRWLHLLPEFGDGPWKARKK